MGIIPHASFAFLSGTVYKKCYHESLKAWGGYLIKKLKSVYMVFVIYNLVYLILHNWLFKINILTIINGDKIYSTNDFLHKIVDIVSLGGSESITGPMWYLIAMFWFTTGYAIINLTISRLKYKEFILWIIIILLFLLGFSRVHFPRMLNNSFILILYYHAGCCYSINSEKIKISKFKKSIIFTVSILLLVNGFILHNDWAKLSAFTIPTAFAGIYVTMRFASKIHSKVILAIGKNTIWILGTHLLAFKLVSYVYILIKSLPINLLGSFNIIENVPLIVRLMYAIVGIAVPVLSLALVKKTLLKVSIKLFREKTMRGN